jgi:hypothetical protein
MLGLIDGPSGTPNLLFDIWQLGVSQKPCLVQEVGLIQCFQIRQHLCYLNRQAACRFLPTATQKFLATLTATVVQPTFPVFLQREVIYCDCPSVTASNFQQHIKVI